MTQYWTITNAEGELVQPCCVTASAEVHPSDCGEPWEEGWVAHPVDAAPDLHCKLWSGSAWVTNLNVLRAKKWEEAEAYRNSRYCEPLPVPQISDGSFIARRDTEGQRWIDRFIGAANTAVITSQPFTISLKDHTGTIHEISETDILQINAASVLQQATMYGKGEAIRALIQAATTAAEIEAIDVAQGYPPAYEDQ
jgi:hypothetical protein